MINTVNSELKNRVLLSWFWHNCTPTRHTFKLNKYRFIQTQPPKTQKHTRSHERPCACASACMSYCVRTGFCVECFLPKSTGMISVSVAVWTPKLSGCSFAHTQTHTHTQTNCSFNVHKPLCECFKYLSHLAPAPTTNRQRNWTKQMVVRRSQASEPGFRLPGLAVYWSAFVM